MDSNKFKCPHCHRAFDIKDAKEYTIVLGKSLFNKRQESWKGLSEFPNDKSDKWFFKVRFCPSCHEQKTKIAKILFRIALALCVVIGIIIFGVLNINEVGLTKFFVSLFVVYLIHKLAYKLIVTQRFVSNVDIDQAFKENAVIPSLDFYGEDYREYYILNEANSQIGPFSRSQLRFLKITNQTQVWYEGLPGWTPASDVETLRPLLPTWSVTDEEKNIYHEVEANVDYQEKHYKKLPPVEPFHALFRGIRLIGQKNTRARKSEGVGLSIFFFAHALMLPYGLFSLGLVKILNKAGMNIEASGGLVGLFIFFYIVIFIILRQANEACCHRRVCDLGKYDPDEMVYYRHGCLGRLLMGSSRMSFEQGDKGDNQFGKSPAYVYVDTSEAEHEYIKLYNSRLTRELITFTLGVASIVAFMFFAFYWGGVKTQRENLAPPTYPTSATDPSVCDIDVDVNDVLGSWATTEVVDGKTDTVIVTFKKNGRDVLIKIDESGRYDEFNGIVVANDQNDEGDKRLALIHHGLVHDPNYYIADKKGNKISHQESKPLIDKVIDKSASRNGNIDKVIDESASRNGNIYYSSVDRLVTDTRKLLKITCNRDTSLLRIEGSVFSNHNYYNKQRFVKSESDITRLQLFELKRVK